MGGSRGGGRSGAASPTAAVGWTPCRRGREGNSGLGRHGSPASGPGSPNETGGEAGGGGGSHGPPEAGERCASSGDVAQGPTAPPPGRR